VKYANALGVAYILTGQFSNALEWFGKVLVQDDCDHKALNNIAVAQYNLGDVEQALVNYKKSVEAGNIDARFNLAMHYLKHRDYAQALELLNGDALDAHFGRGLVYMEQGDDEKAQNSFSYVLELAPHHAGAYYNMGFIATRMGRYEDSLSYIRRGMEIEPNYDNERYHLSLDPALSEFGPYYIPKLQPPATEIVDNVIVPQAVSPEELLAEAENLLSKNEVNEALDKVDKALEMAPDDSKAIVLKAEILYHHDEDERAMKLLADYQDDNPNVVEVLRSWARMLKEKGKIEKAKEVYTGLSELEPNNLSWLNEVADLSYSLGEEDEALSFYRKIHEQDDSNIAANLRLLRIYLNKRKLDEAASCLSLLEPNNQDVYEFNMLAGIYWSERKEYEKAIGYFDKAIELDSSQPMPYYHRGLLEVQLGAFQAACENWKRALLLSPPEDLAYKIRHCLNLTVELSEILENEI
jgi:tetratricopeptide (TPR) repeat protein